MCPLPTTSLITKFCPHKLHYNFTDYTYFLVLQQHFSRKIYPSLSSKNTYKIVFSITVLILERCITGQRGILNQIVCDVLSLLSEFCNSTLKNDKHCFSLMLKTSDTDKFDKKVHDDNHNTK
jgi:hypothetical protein